MDIAETHFALCIVLDHNPIEFCIVFEIKWCWL